MKPLIITFCTPEYIPDAEQLRQTCSAQNLELLIFHKESLHSWSKNCTMKIDVILDALTIHNKPVIWLDADARVVGEPILFSELHQYDFAAYFIPDIWNQARNEKLRPWKRADNRALFGGTMYFNNSEIVKSMLKDTQVLCAKQPHIWEQQSLQTIWDDYDNNGLRTFFFPQAYAKILMLSGLRAKQGRQLSSTHKRRAG